MLVASPSTKLRARTRRRHDVFRSLKPCRRLVTGVFVTSEKNLNARSEFDMPRICARRVMPSWSEWDEKGAGAPGGTRTHDLLLRRQTLYPLSYGRSISG